MKHTECTGPRFVLTALIATSILTTAAHAQVAEQPEFSDPAAAAVLSLTEEQQTTFATIIKERDEALAAAEEGAKNGINAAAEEKLSAALTTEQKQAFADAFQSPRLKFNFRSQKWEAVLNWVAGEADLSLVMDAAPPGTFNYSDTKEYTPTEAIDLLNGWLLTKGHTLVRRERLLMCINLKGGLPEGAIPRISPEELESRGRFDFVRILLPLEGRPPESTLAEIQPLLGTYGKAEVLTATQQIQVADSAATVRAIQEVVSKVPVPSAPAAAAAPPAPVITVYAIKHANVKQAGKVLKQIVIDGKVAADEVAGQISVNAVPAEQAKVKIVLEQMEANQGQNQQPELKLYPVQVANTAELVSTMQLLVPEGQFRHDVASNKLVAWAPIVDHERIASALKELLAADTSVGARQLHVYPLKDIELSAAQSVLSSLLPNVRVTVDSQTRSLIAVGSISDHEAINRLLEELEPQTAASKPTELKSYSIDSTISSSATSVLATVVPEARVTTDIANKRLLVVAPAGKHEIVAATLASLAENLSSANHAFKIYDTPGVDTTSALALLAVLAPDAQITNDLTNERLLAIASPEAHGIIDNVLNQVADRSQTHKRVLKSYPLSRKTVSSTVISLLSTLTPRASVTDDSANRRLLITATPKDHEAIAASIAQIESDAGGEKPELEYYALESASGADAAALLQAMLPAARITFEQPQNRLSVVALKADHATLQETLTKLEAAAPPNEKRALTVYTVTTAQRSRFTAILPNLTAELPGVQMLADTEPNELTIWAKPSQQEIIAGVLTQLKAEVAPENQPQLVIYPIENGTPTETSTLLTGLYPDARITVDAANSRLLVHAIPTLHERVKQTMVQLADDSHSGENSLKSYPLAARVEPSTVVSLLSSLTPKAAVTTDAASRRLLITASQKDHEKIAAAIAQVAHDAGGDVPELQYYALESADGTNAASVLQAMLPTARVTFEKPGNRISAVATKADHAILRETLTKLEAAAPPNEKRVLTVYPVTSAQRARFTAILTNLTVELPGLQLLTDAQPGELTVWAKPSQHEIVAGVLTQLQREVPPEAQPQLVIYPVENGIPANVSTVLAGMYPDANITIDTVDSKILVHTTPQLHERIKQTIAQLTDESHSGETTLKSYPLEPKVEPSTVVSMLASLTPKASVTTDAASRRLLITASAKDHEKIAGAIEQVTRDAGGDVPELEYYALKSAEGENAVSVLQAMLPTSRIAYEQSGNRISAVATKADHAILQKTLAKLEAAAPPNEKRTLKVYDVTTPQRTRFTAVLTNLTSELPGLQVLTDAQPGELTVWAKPSQHEVVGEVLTQLQREVPPELKPQLIVYPIRQVDPESVATVLTELFPDAKITTDAVASRLLVHAKPAMQESVKLTIEQLDSDVDGNVEIRLMVYPIKGIDPANATTVIQSEVPRATVVHDATAQTLIVRAGLQHQQRVAEILDALQAASTTGQKMTVAVYPKFEGDYRTQTTFFQNAFPDATVNIDRESNAMTVRASAKDHIEIRKAVESMLDIDKKAEGSMKSYNIGDADVSALPQMLAQAVPRGRFVFADKKLLAWGMPEDHVVIEQVVDGLEEAEAGRKIAAFDVSRVGISTAQAVLTKIAPDITFLQSTDGESVIAWVNDDQKLEIETTLAELAASPAASDERSLKFYDIDKAGGTDAQSVLAAAAPTVSFRVSTDGHRLLAMVTPKEHEKVEAALLQLLKEQPFATDATMKLYSIRDLGSAATTVLSRSVPDASISSGARGDQIAVVASPEDHKKVTEVLVQLTASKSVPERPILQVYNIEGTDPVAVQRVLQPLVEGDVNITVDTRGSRIYVRALGWKQRAVKEIIDQVTADLEPDGTLETKTYLVGAPNATEAQEVLQALYPTITIVTDRQRKLLIATATPVQHVMIKQIAEQVSGAHTEEEAYPVVYHSDNVPPTEVQQLLANLYTQYDQVKLAVNEKTGRIVAVATEEQHLAISELIQQFDGLPDDETKMDLAVYRVAPLDGFTVKRALEPLVSVGVTISAQRRSSEILVSAPAEEQKKIAELVEKMTNRPGGSQGSETRTYRLQRGEADEAQEALIALFPDATIVTDAGREVLVATATQQQHETIERVVKQMTSENGDENMPVPKSYSLNQADGATVLRVLQGLFLTRDNVRLSLDAANKTIVAIARPHQHSSIASLLKDLDPSDGSGIRKLQIYSVEDFDGNMMVQVADNVLQQEDTQSTVVYERASSSLLVTTTPAGHELVAEALSRIEKPEPQKTEVFQLSFLDPLAAENAIDRMVTDQYLNQLMQPQVHGDEDLQQIWVRATEKQITEMRSLLIKMGESGLKVADGAGDDVNFRVIPINDDVDAAIKRIQDLWPKLRKNPIRILKPRQSMKPINGQFSIPPEQDEAAADTVDEDSVVIAPAPAAEAVEPEVAMTPEETPVVIMPGDHRITIASDDVEALEQMESLFRAAFSTATPRRSRNRDFSIYQLNNAGANEIAATLKQVFGRNRALASLGRVLIVPEDRLNAVIVYGSRTDRERIEQLLEVLDSGNLGDTRRAFQTKVIAIEHANATRVSRVISGVFRAQMTAGGARSRITVPQGVPAEVATVLRQINAAASSPLLTVEVEFNTNSLVVKAPRDLLEEVEELIADLDESSSKNRARGVTLLPLKKTNSSRVMRILNDVMK